MRNKRNGQATFTRAFDTFLTEFTKPSCVAHVHVRGNTLTSTEATDELIQGIRQEMGNVTPVFHKMRRSLA